MHIFCNACICFSIVRSLKYIFTPRLTIRDIIMAHMSSSALLDVNSDKTLFMMAVTVKAELYTELASVSRLVNAVNNSLFLSNMD